MARPAKAQRSERDWVKNQVDNRRSPDEPNRVCVGSKRSKLRRENDAMRGAVRHLKFWNEWWARSAGLESHVRPSKLLWVFYLHSWRRGTGFA